MKSLKINEQKFLELYNKGLNDREISLHFDCTTTLINYYRNSKNLPPNKIIREISQKQLNLMVGSLLGDMSLYRPKRTPNSVNSYAGGFTHSIKQKDYFMFKYNNLSNLMGKIYYPINKRNGKEYLHISSYFLQGLHLKPLYEAFYNPIKNLPNKDFIFENFNELSLAVLFADDGSLAKLKYSGYNLASMGFDYPELYFLQDMFYKKFNLKSTLRKDKTIYIRYNCSITISDAIRNNLDGTINYKIMS